MNMVSTKPSEQLSRFELFIASLPSIRFSRIFNLYVFFFIFVFVNKKFAVLIDWRIPTFALGLIVLVLSPRKKLKVSPLSFWIGAIFIFVSLISTCINLRSNLSYSNNATYRVILSNINNLLAISIFLMNYDRLSWRYFASVYFFSLFFLLISVFLDAANVPIHKLTIHEAYIENLPHPELSRPTGWVYGPNIVVLVTVPYLVLIFALHHSRRWLHFLILFPMLALVRSRTFFVGSCIVLLYLLYKKSKILFTFALSQFVLWSALYYHQIIDFLLQHSMSFRFRIWKMALEKILNQPWLGYGISGSRYFSLPLQYGTIHNTYLTVLGDSGLIGLGCYLLLISRTLDVKNIYYRAGWLLMFLYALTQEYTFSVQIVIFYYLVYKLIYSHEKSASYNHRLKAAPAVSR